MTKNNAPSGSSKSQTASRKQRVRRRIKASTSFNAVDMAVLGALMVLVNERANAAETQERVSQEADKGASADATQALLGLSEGSSAELVALTAMAGQMFREMERGIGRVRFGAELGADKPNDIDWGADPSVGGWKFSANLPNFSRSMLRENVSAETDAIDVSGEAVEQLLDRGNAAGGLNDPEGYRVATIAPQLQIQSEPDVAGNRLEALDLSGEKLLEMVRGLFKEEISDVMARVDPSKLDGTEFAEIDYQQVTAEDVEGGFFVPPIAGGGGGGGGSVVASSSSSGFGGIAIDGYVSGATVFWDVNGNFTLDTDEIWTTTDDDGVYYLDGVVAGIGQIVLLDDGIDVNTGGSVGMMATSTTVTDTTAAMITPLTLLMSQGISEEAVKTALGLSGSDVDLSSYDPVAILAAAAGGETEAGSVLLQAQQLFASINAIANLSGSSTDTLADTITAISSAGIENFVGTDGGDDSVMQSVISTVLPDFDTELALSAAQAIKGVNAAIGEFLTDSANALSTSARAATLVSQNDLVTQFKSIGMLSDAASVKTELADKLGKYASAALVKANFATDYQTAIAAQDAAGRGIIAGVDELSLTVGSEQTINSSSLLSNDRNLSTGTLSIVSVEPFGLTWTTHGLGTKLEVLRPSGVKDVFFRLVLPVNQIGSLAEGSYLKLKVDGLVVQVRVEASDLDADAEVMLSNLTAKLAASAALQSDRIAIVESEDTAGLIQIRRADGVEVSQISLQTAAPSDVLDAFLNDDGTISVTLDDSLAGVQANLRYVVSNGSAQSVGIVRLTGEPSVQTLSLLSDAADSVIEQTVDADGDVSLGSFSIADRVSLVGDLSEGVTQRMVVALTSMKDADGNLAVNPKQSSGFVLEFLGADGNPVQVDMRLGVGEGLALPTGMTLQEVLSAANVTLPDGFKGSFTFNYRLTQSINDYVASTNSGADAMDVLGSAEGDTPTLLYGIGTSGSLVEFGLDAIAPLVTDPSANQVLRLRLDGGDLTEERWVEIANLPTGIEQVWVTFEGGDPLEITDSLTLGTLRVDEPSDQRGQPFVLEFVASESLVDSAYGLSEDAITFTVVNREVGSTTEVSDGSVSLKFDIGGAYGLVVVADESTASEEDLATSLGQLQVVSVSDGARVEVTVQIDANFSLLDVNDAAIFPESVDNASGLATYVLLSSTDQADEVSGPLHFLDGIQVKPPENFSTLSGESVTANVVVRALDTEGVELSSVEKSLGFTFEGLADGVNYTISDTSERVGLEDTILSVSDLFFDTQGTSLAQKIDDSETLYFVLRGLPSGSRLIDGTTYEDIGRVSGDDVILTATEALGASIQLSGNASLDSTTFTLFAYTQEPGTVSVSEYGDESGFESSFGGDVDVRFDAVADAPFLSLDSRVRGLVNVDGLTEELLEKTTLSIPANAYLQDTDGSESLWFRLSATTKDDAGNVTDVDLAEFQFSGVTDLTDGYFDETNGAYFVSALALSDLLISRPGDADPDVSNSFSGTFYVDALSIEGLDSEPTAQDAAVWVSSKPIADDSWISTDASWAFTRGELEVEFLQPAREPVVTLGDVAYRSVTDTDGVAHVLEFTINVDYQADDQVTILMTGVPALAAVPAKFYCVSTDAETSEVTTTPIGAPAEVEGVWVFDLAGLGEPDDIIRMVLPADYTLSQTPFDVTAFAVDSLGLTNASTDAIAVTFDGTYVAGFTVPADALDPVMIDTEGDGLVLQAGPVAFDLDGNGSKDNVAWTTEGSDDAFLIFADDELDQALLANESVSIDGDYLVTEYLDSDRDPTSNALSDLRSLAGDDEKLTETELLESGKDARLWFDLNADGLVDRGELRSVSNFELDLSQLTDNAEREPVTGAVIAGGLPAGAMAGEYTNPDGEEKSLADGVLSDVYLPVFKTTTQNESSLADAALAGTEDDPDGFNLASVLWGGDVDWVSNFSEDAAAKINSGEANVLLTVSAQQAGTTFNLSQGARLDGQTTDTWLMLWDPTSTDSLSELRLFAAENYSGPIDLSFRATVVYTDSDLSVNSYTVSRGVALDIEPVADRPEFKSSNQISKLTLDADGLEVDSQALSSTPVETDAAVTYSLDGLYLAPRDTGEVVSLTVTPPANLPTGARLLFKGESLALSDGKYVVEGAIDASDIWVELPAYASGTYKFGLSASTQDGDQSLETPVTSQFAITVKPVAQAPDVSIEILSTATEITKVTDFKVSAALRDTDGSEEISTVTVKLVLSNVETTISSAPQLIVGSETISLTKTIGVANTYSAVISKSLFDIDTDGAASTKTLTAQLVTPEYYDGEFTLSARATSVENADVTARATSLSAVVTGTVQAAAQDLLAFDARGLSVNSGESFALSDMVSALSAKDGDETIEITLDATGLADSSSLLVYKDNVSVGDVKVGPVTLSNVKFSELGRYTLATNDSQGDFSLKMTAATFDNNQRDVTTNTASSSLARTVSIGSTPLYEPVIVGGSGGAFVNSLTFSEGGAATLSIGVKVGSKLNTSDSFVTIAVPDGLDTDFTLHTVVDNALISNVNGGFTIQASKLSRGLLLTPVDDDFSGSLTLNLVATTNYTLNDSSVSKTSAQVLNVTVNPVTDGFEAATISAAEEDATTWKLSDLLVARDSSESVVAVTVSPNALVEIKGLGDVEFRSIGPDEKINAADLDGTVFRTVNNANGAISLGLNVESMDPGATKKIETIAVELDVAAVSDLPVVTDAESLLQIYEDDSRSTLLDAPVQMTVGASSGVSLFVTLGGFHTADAKESVSAVLVGDAIINGTVLYLPDALAPEASFVAQWNSTAERYEIEVPGDGAVFVETSATLVLPSNVALVGKNDISVIAKTTDGLAASNLEISDTDQINVQSMGMPSPPVVGFDADFKLSDIGVIAGKLQPFSVDLLALVRGSDMTSDQIIELVVPAGFSFNNVTPETGLLHSSTPALGGDIGVVRLTYDQLHEATVTIDPSTFTRIDARFGVLDGYVDGDELSGARYTYSKFAGLAYTFGQDGSEANDAILVHAQGQKVVDGGAGDDVILVRGAPELVEIKGGIGRDTLDFSGLTISDGAGQRVVVDLNQGQYTFVKPGGLEQSSSVDGIELVLGSDADDMIIGVGDTTISQVLRGRAGDDYLVGGSGNDTLEGGEGDDVLYGGSGADYFVISDEVGFDLIDDFSVEDGDKIIVRGNDPKLEAFSFVTASSLMAVSGSALSETLAMASADDWVLTSSGSASLAVVLANSSHYAVSELMPLLALASDFGSQFEVFDPAYDTNVQRINAMSLEVPSADIAVASAWSYANKNGVDLTNVTPTFDNAGFTLDDFFGAEHNFDDIGDTLSVIADAKFTQALEIRLSGELVDVTRSTVGTDFHGFSGSDADDVLLASSSDAVLFGGMGGSDRLVGDSGSDVLIATVQSARGAGDEVSLEGGGGADQFTIVNLNAIIPEEITDTLNTIYSVRIEDFNREEGDRISLVGFDKGTDVSEYVEIGDVSETANGRVEQTVYVQPDLNNQAQGLTVVFDISFMRQFDSEFQIRHADFDAI